MGWWNRRNRKQAVDVAAPVVQPEQAAQQDEALNHCPRCGSGNVVGGSDGSIECGFCNFVFKVFAQPTHPYMPQTVNGQPYEVPGSPRLSDEPVPAAGSPSPVMSDGPTPGAGGGGLERFRVDAAPGAPTPGLERFRAARFVTSDGIALPFDSFVAHLAIKHAQDRPGVIRKVRASRG